MPASPPFAVDFSLALHNRTGKYFIGRDLLEAQAASLGPVYYWRLAANTTPIGLKARLLGKALSVEDRLRAFPSLRRGLRFRPRQPMLHLDPFTVLHCKIEARDIVLCHDLGPITHPNLFSQAVVQLYERAYDQIRQADPTIVFVSESSKRAFVSLYGPLSRMQVIYPPIRLEIAAGVEQPIPGIDSPFLLTVGSIGHRKNQACAIEAFGRSGLAREGWSYILCGSAEPGSSEVTALAQATPGVKLLPYVSDGALNWLYRHAGGFLLPSRLEGFGVPVAEAISRGLIPIVSRDSVLEEVAGEGALTVDASSVDEISGAILRLAKMPEREREQRLGSLRTSITRFSRSAFDDGWSRLLSDTSRAGLSRNRT